MLCKLSVLHWLLKKKIEQILLQVELNLRKVSSGQRVEDVYSCYSLVF